MKEIKASITAPNTYKYPIHSHINWEIMYYLEGEGYLATNEGNINFSKGDIIIVPPKLMHGSIAQGGFVNISISGEFNHYFVFQRAVKLHDDSYLNGEALARLIFHNRYQSNDYLSSLCDAYVNFLLQNSVCQTGIKKALTQIISEINANFYDCNFNVTKVLISTGYAEDYVRAEFKKLTGLTPVKFLNKTRIDHAKKLAEIYRDNITVGELAHISGFDDPIYFSRCFKQLTGISPNSFKEGFVSL